MSEEILIKKALNLGAEYCDIRFEERIITNIELKNKELKQSYIGSEKGIGIRVLYNNNVGFFSTNNFEKLDNAVEQAIKFAKALQSKEVTKYAIVTPEKCSYEQSIKINPLDIPINEKQALVKHLNEIILMHHGINTVTTTYTDTVINSKFINSENTEICGKTVRSFIQSYLVARDGSNVVGYRNRIGATAGFEIFKNKEKEFAESAKNVISLLHSRVPTGGKYTVVIDPILIGVFIHEAIGHATEGDLVINGQSILANKLNTKIGNDIVNICDDATIPGSFGHIYYDDEGIKAQSKNLIESGILKNYILDRTSAYKLNLKPNGGARAESYAYPPLVRMSTTILAPGDMSFEELVEDIKYGIYLKGTRGGQVNTAQGTFQFSAQQGYLIENGKLTNVLRDVSMLGNILEILKNIVAVGKDFTLGEPGFCGKGQLVPVSNGGPHTKIENVLIGGK